MLPRLCHRTYRRLRLRRPCRHFSSLSSPPSSSSNSHHTQRPLKFPKDVTDNLEHQQFPPRIMPQASHSLSPLSSFSRSRNYGLLSAAILSAAAAFYLIFNPDNPSDPLNSNSNSNHYRQLYSTIEHTIDRSNESGKKIIHRMKQTGVAASVLWQSLTSVLSSANQEVKAGFEFRVASFLADIAAASPSRRAAIVAAGDGKVLDWLLVSVGTSAGDGNGTQAEAARALAYMIADPNVREEVFARPHAVPHLLRFIFLSQPQRAKKNLRRSSFDLSDSLKGRSMLVAAIMDVVTSSCESRNKASLHPSLPTNAETTDIAAAIQVIEGGMNVDDSHGNEDDDGGKGLKGIGIKVTGETTVIGLSRTSELMECTEGTRMEPERRTPKNFAYKRRNDNFFGEANLSSAVVPGLWDDLHSRHVAVPFAVWALANWAMASEGNRIHIQDLDQDGHAVATALAAPERSVKWHASLVARLLLEDNNLPLNDSVSEWSSNLLSTISHACKTEDFPLAQMGFSAFLLSLERSSAAKRVIMEKGLDVMRDTAKQTRKHTDVQESLAKSLKLIYSGDLCLSLEESQKWSGVLLPWACGKFSSENTRSFATRILSHILEDFGPMSLSISQSWLTILLTEILGSVKAAAKENIQPKPDKVKTQINQANISSASQIANQLASAVVSLAGSQDGTTSYSADTFPLADLLSQEPFLGPYKSMNKDRNAKIHVADSAMATLKGIKALTEVSAEDLLYQNQIVDSGVLCLLRRYLLRDDYEKLAAMEAYDASRDRELEHQISDDAGQSTDFADEASRVRIPPTAHIRRHAARLLMILSALPKVQNVIIVDDSWCEWLELCANGKIPGCNDPKIQSYARATLLNVHCSGKGDADSRKSSGSGDCGAIENRTVPRYDDMIFLINPESSHWKCPDKPESRNYMKEISYTKNQRSINESSGLIENSGSFKINSANGHESTQAEEPSLDVVFVHGLRGGPFKTWRISEDKASTKSGLVEKIDQEAGKQGTFWPGEWLPIDFPHARLFSLKYKSNLTQWSGASLPLQEVSSMLLEKIVAAGIGNRPVVFVTHSMGGLVVKQLLYQAKAENLDNLVRNTIGIVFYSCPHFGSKLADMPWRMGLVLRPAPTIGELRSGSARLVELNDFIRRLHKKRLLEVLSFCETKVTPIVEGYGGWAFRMEIVPIESAYPGYGDIVVEDATVLDQVLESTDHINSCKPLSRDDPSYTQILEFLRKLKAEYT